MFTHCRDEGIPFWKQYDCTKNTWVWEDLSSSGAFGDYPSRRVVSQHMLLSLFSFYCFFYCFFSSGHVERTSPTETSSLNCKPSKTIHQDISRLVQDWIFEPKHLRVWLHYTNVNKDTVDGINPAPPGMYKTLYCKYWDIHHINWCRMSSINRVTGCFFRIQFPLPNFCSTAQPLFPLNVRNPPSSALSIDLLLESRQLKGEPWNKEQV